MKTKKFAIDSAERIFNELCKSDGFHQDDEIPTEFIKTIMADVFQSNMIKGLIGEQIHDDLKENPKAFLYDDDENPIYDSGMRDDYESIVTDYIRERFNKEGKTKYVYVCTQCNSDNVQIKAWVKPNEDNKFIDEVEGDEMGWCDDCNLPTEIDVAELPANAKVIGFQVIGEEGTAEEGDIHPMMDSSFALYNLTQAREMLNDKDNGDEQWQLLAIWDGDVEEPTLMFETDPRD